MRRHVRRVGTCLQPGGPGPRLFRVGDLWGGGGVDGAGREERFFAPDEESWERHTRILDVIEQVRAARELRRQRGLGPPAG